MTRNDIKSETKINFFGIQNSVGACNINSKIGILYILSSYISY